VFDVGFTEIMLIGIVALMVIGPERLPAVARKVGLYVGKLQRFVAGVKSDIKSELKADELRGLLNSQEDQIRELKNMVDETRSDMAKTARQASDAVSKGMNAAEAQVRDAADAAQDNNDKMEQIAKAAGYGYGDNSSVETQDKTDSTEQADAQTSADPLPEEQPAEAQAAEAQAAGEQPVEPRPANTQSDTAAGTDDGSASKSA